MTDAEFLADYEARLRRAAAIGPEIARAIAALRDRWRALAKTGSKVMLFGNGGSAAIVQHIAVDLTKNGGVQAVSLDAGAITCLANDFGHDNWMAEGLRLWHRPGDFVVAVSSSGRSPNVLALADRAKALGLGLATFSGFAPDNPLRGRGDVDFWVDSRAYNIVETAHQFWLMAAVDLLIGRAEYPASPAR
ncbi:MAG: SIS domain-containing protein [Tagaea sp.]|nr:SIS domain-containing protein [Tagaea sp.]